VANASSYALGDLTAQAGSQVRGNCMVGLGTSTVSLPVVITHGSAAGPVLAITAGIHGGEYVPIVAVRQFVRDLDLFAAVEVATGDRFGESTPCGLTTRLQGRRNWPVGPWAGGCPRDRQPDGWSTSRFDGA
jgi:hypothetical protein